MTLPHFYRNIPRISHTLDVNIPNVFRLILALLIVAAFGMYISTIRISKVKGAKTQTLDLRQSEFLQNEIEKTVKVTQNRPDYAGAWLRLSVLYEEMGDNEKANAARATAQRLNPDN